MRLEIKIFTGEATEKYLAKLKKRSDDVSHTNSGETETCCAATTSDAAGRTGHMFKMMSEINIFLDMNKGKRPANVLNAILYGWKHNEYS